MNVCDVFAVPRSPVTMTMINAGRALTAVTAMAAGRGVSGFIPDTPAGSSRQRNVSAVAILDIVSYFGTFS